MVEKNRTEYRLKENLNHFSEELTSELKSILKSQFGKEPSDAEIQKIGYSIVCFITFKAPKNYKF